MALSQDHGVRPHARQELSMSKKPISPLRRRLIDDITARRFSEDTKKDYVRNVRKFADFLGRSPNTATSEDLRRFQLHLAQQQVSPSTINAAIAALRFLFTVTLEKPDLVRPLRIVTEPRKAPVVLSQEEVSRLLQAAPGLKYKAALEPRLRRRPPGVRSRPPEGVRHRQPAHDAPGRAGQGTAGSRCDAVAATAPAPARMVEGGAAAGLALSRPEPDQSGDRAAAQPRRHRRQRSGGHLQARFSAYAAAQLCDPPARTGRRYSRNPGVVGAREARDDRALHPRRRQHGPRHQESAGPAGRQADEENAARLTTAAWRGLPSRSPTSFALMGRHGGRPTPGT